MGTEHFSGKVAVIGGAGLMGHGIVLQALLGGATEVAMMARHRSSLEHGLELVAGGPFGLRSARSSQTMTEAEITTLLHRIVITTDYAEAVAGAEVIVESVPEEIAVNRRCLPRLKNIVPPTR